METPSYNLKEVKAGDRELMPPVWDISQERAYIEPLLNQRFNFFLLFFSLVTMGAINARSQVHFILILGVGALITAMLASVLWHTQEKLDATLAILLTDTSHPATVVNAQCRSKTKRTLIGRWIPITCSVLLWLGFVMALVGCLRAVPSNQAPPNPGMQPTALQAAADAHR